MKNSEAVAVLIREKRLIYHDDFREAIDKAVSALKEAEVRVLSFDEAHGAIDPIMFEIKGISGIWWVDVVLMEDFFNKTAQSAIRNLYAEAGDVFSRVPEEYGKTWRCWNKRPTDEQRKAAAWE